MFIELSLLREDTVWRTPNLVIQTSFTRNAFTHYLEVLIMDTTYRLCENDMPLIVFEVIDCFDAGRVARYTLISSEKRESF